METEEREDLEVPYPQYRCPICGKDLPLNDARMTVTCAEHLPRKEAPGFTVRRATAGDRREIEEICDQALGETDVDVFGRTFDVLIGINLVAESEGRLAGLLSLAVHAGELAVVLLSVYPAYQGRGVGSSLVAAAVAYAEEKGLPGVVVAVTNDDIPQLYFYQRHGFRIYGCAVGQLVLEDGSTPGGFSDIPVRDEIRMRRSISPRR